jgi:cytochrome c oxidase subunit II
MMWSMVMMRILALIAGLALVAAMLTACGDESATATPVPPAATATPAAEPTPAAGGDGDPEAGRRLAGAQCTACHSVDGSPAVGPTWLGLYGSEIELESGETVIADDEYIHESIVDPNEKIHKGYPAIMPSFAQILSEQQIQDIIAYIRTLD